MAYIHSLLSFNCSISPELTTSVIVKDNITHFPRALEYLISLVGVVKVVMGTDYLHDMGNTKSIETVNSLKNIPDEDKEKMVDGNECWMRTE